MKRRTLFKAAALSTLGALGDGLVRGAQADTLHPDERAMIEAIAAAALPTSLPPERRTNAVVAFVYWLAEYRAGVPMSYGYGNDLKYAVVPPSPLPRYREQFKRLQALARAHGSSFTALSLETRRAVLQTAILETNVSELPDRPEGRHVATDFLGHFYGSSDGNDFLFNSLILRAGCRGLDDSGERPAAIV